MVRWSIVALLAIFFLFGGYNFTDLGQAVTYYGIQIFPSQPQFGSVIFMVIFFFLIFSSDIFAFVKKKKKKIKVKKKF